MQGYATTPEKVPCDGCGATGAVVQSVWEERLCPTCMTRFALAYAAHDHLRLLLTNALTEWMDSWQAHPHVIAPLEDSASVIAGEIGEKLLSERTTRRDIKLKKTA